MSNRRRTPHDQAPEGEPEPEAVRPMAGGGAEPDPRIEQLSSQLEEANNRLMRTAADFDNFRKRARQEQEETVHYAASRVLEQLLPVLDDFERVLAHSPEEVEDGWLKGVELSVQKLRDVLAEHGVEAIEAVGQPFDPKFHEAIGSEASELPEDHVASELRRGYRLRERVLRPALVRLAGPD